MLKFFIGRKYVVKYKDIFNCEVLKVVGIFKNIWCDVDMILFWVGLYKKLYWSVFVRRIDEWYLV